MVIAMIPVFIFGLQPAALAVDHPNPAYAYTAEPNSQAESVYIVACTKHYAGYCLTDVRISWEVKTGDIVKVNFWDETATQLQSTTMDTSQTSVRNRVVQIPSGAYWAQIELFSSSEPGLRYAWFKQATNNKGVVTYFPDPEWDEGAEPPPYEPPPENPPPYDPPEDTSGIMSELSGIRSQLGGISSDIRGVNQELQGIKSQVSSIASDMTEVKSELSGIRSQLNTLTDDMNSQFGDVKNKLDTISADVKVIKSDVAAMKDYITTPRTPPPYQMDPMPQASFDSTISDMSEPHQEPYTYDQPHPTMPPAEFGPEPLPLAPDPEVMPHEEPRQAEEPIQIDEPTPRQDPRPQDPVLKEPPLQQDPVLKEPPLQQDPVMKEPPRQMDPVRMDPPIETEPPITQETPYQAQPPLTPSPPIAPQPPRTPGG